MTLSLSNMLTCRCFNRFICLHINRAVAPIIFIVGVNCHTRPDWQTFSWRRSDLIICLNHPPTHLYMFEVGELTDLTNLTYLTTSYTGLSIVRGYRVIISQRIQGDPWQQDTGWSIVIRYRVINSKKKQGDQNLQDIG